MRQDKLTSKFQLALSDAQSLAVGRGHQFIEPVHLMAALLDQQGGTVRHLLTKAGANVNLLRSRLGESLDQLAQVEGTAGEVHISNDLGRLLNVCDKLSQDRSDQFISSELFVLAACDDKSPVGKILAEAGVVRGAVEAAIDELRGGQSVDDPNAEETRQALEKYTIDLTEQAEQGKLDPIIGRDDEIRRTIQIFKGTGLGLSVVHGIVQSHDGLIQVDSAPGRGATFTIYLPAAPPDTRNDDPSPDDLTAPGNEHILLVDDEADIARLGQRLLEPFGYRVTAFADPRAALRAFRRTPEEFDVLVTDLTMPRMSGLDLAEAVRALGITIPIVLTTGYADVISPEQACAFGITDLIMKPLVGRTLTQRIRRAIDTRQNKNGE